MSIYSSRRRSRRGFRTQLGHLKLSVYEEASSLVVTIFEARGLQRKDGTPMDTYFKLYLLPDPQKQTKEKTKIVKEKDPIFNQKFSFILTEQDQAKRLLISAWSHHSTSRNEMIGCMSFLVADLLGPDKGLNGWYQLLEETRGRAESIQVPSSISKYESSSFGFQQSGQRTFAVTLARSDKGYGFSVNGHNPVYVTQVEDGLPAQQADIQVGDVIAEVEGTDVTRASGELVISIVGKCPETLHLILQREASSPFNRTRVNSALNYSTSLSSHPPAFLSQSFVSIPSSGGSVGRRRSGRPALHSNIPRSLYSSQTQLLSSEYHGLRRFTTPMSYNPMLSQPAHCLTQGGAPYGYDQRAQDYRGEEVFAHEAFLPTYSQWMSTQRRGSRGEPEAQEGPKGARTPQKGEEGRLREKEGQGSNSKLARDEGQPRQTNSRNLSQKSSDSHEDQLHSSHLPGTSHTPNHTPSRYAFSQPGHGEQEVFPPYHTAGHRKHLTVASRHPYTHQPLFSMTQLGPEVGGAGGDRETVERPIFQRMGSFSPLRHPPSLHGTVGVYQPRTGIYGNKPNGTMSSNGSIATSTTDSAYTSGLSNQSGNCRSPVESEGPGSRTAGNGMRTEGGAGHHPLRPSSSATSRSSLTGSRDSSHFSRGLSEDEGPLEWESLGSLEQKRQKALNSMMNAELAFHNELKTGLDTYLGPLRSIVSESAHKAIFINLEELHSLSTDVIGQLKSRRLPYNSQSSPVPFYLPAVADIYHGKVDQLVSALQFYQEHLQSARQEIALAFTNQEFTSLVQSSVVNEKKPSIYSFLEAGREYLPKLTRYMMGVSFFTPLWYDDHKYLTSVINVLATVCADRELTARWRKDSETMRSLQLCIGFAQKVQPFQVAIPGRLLLHEGEVALIEKKRKKKIWMLVFSDILVLTRQQGKILTSIESPFSLEHLMVQDLNCTDATEFHISSVDGAICRMFRAPSVSAKKEWMQLLKERATGSLTHRRRPGEKAVLRNLPKIDAPRKPLLPIPSSSVARDDGESSSRLVAMTALGSPEGNGRAKEEGGEEGAVRGGKRGRRLSQQHEPPPDYETLDRRAPKRRSLFNVGSKSERSAGKAEREKVEKRGGKKTRPVRQTRRSLDQMSLDLLRRWESSFESLLQHPDGMVLFEDFLKSEFSEENIQFWKACERYKTVPEDHLQKEAEVIFDEFVSQHAPKLVNIDHQTTKDIIEKMQSPNRESFTRAQHSVYLLMARDSFVRFVKSEPFQLALNR